MDAGLDSLSAVEFRNELSSRLDGVALPSTLVFDYPSVNAIVAYLEASLAGPRAVAAPVRAVGGVGLSGAGDELAVIGMGCRFPGGSDSPEAFWSFLCSGRDGVTRVPFERWDADVHFDPDMDRPNKSYVCEGGFVSSLEYFDNALFGISDSEAGSMDPQQRLFLEVAYAALSSGGYSKETLLGASVGVFAGCCNDDFKMSLSAAGRAFGVYTATSVDGAILANRLSFALGLKGPSMTINTACSSSLVAANVAALNLRQGACRVAVVGGVNLLLSADGFIATSKARML